MMAPISSQGTAAIDNRIAMKQSDVGSSTRFEDIVDDTADLAAGWLAEDGNHSTAEGHEIGDSVDPAGQAAELNGDVHSEEGQLLSNVSLDDSSTTAEADSEEWIASDLLAIASTESSPAMGQDVLPATPQASENRDAQVFCPRWRSVWTV